MSRIPSCSLKAAEPQCHKRIVDQSLDSPSKCRIEMVMLKLGLSRDELPFDGPSMYCQIYRTLILPSIPLNYAFQATLCSVF
jgi:hypothetical protein